MSWYRNRWIIVLIGMIFYIGANFLSDWVEKEGLIFVSGIIYWLGLVVVILAGLNLGISTRPRKTTSLTK